MPSDAWLASCRASVVYWVLKSREPGRDHGFDYQEMGLGNDTFDAFRAVERATRALPDLTGPSLAAQADKACRDHHPTTPTGDGWR